MEPGATGVFEMKNMYLVGLSVILSMSVACAVQGGQEDPGSTHDAVEELAGVANQASVYCARLGYVAEAETCSFPDGTSCEQWSFFRGECGQAHSSCNRQGGQVFATTENDAEGFRVTYALCKLPSGASCKEQDFATTGRCE